MTTIATDGKTVAFDSLANARGFLMGTDQQKAIEIAPGIIVAAAGLADDGELFRRWAAASLVSENPEKPKLDAENFCGIIVDVNNGTCRYYKSPLLAQHVIVPFAIGSGDDLAIGAMLAGATPLEAVKVAAIRDLHTGGTIRELPEAAC